MAQRTTSGEVKGVLLRDYDYVNNPSLQTYIDTATRVISRVVVCATSKGITIDAATLRLMEAWMSAYYYTKSDPTYLSKSTGGASGSFEKRSYKDGALDLDPSGCLNAILERRSAGTVWLGKVPSEQIDAEDRD